MSIRSINMHDRTVQPVINSRIFRYIQILHAQNATRLLETEYTKEQIRDKAIK